VQGHPTRHSITSSPTGLELPHHYLPLWRYGQMRASTPFSVFITISCIHQIRLLERKSSRSQVLHLHVAKRTQENRIHPCTESDSRLRSQRSSARIRSPTHLQGRFRWRGNIVQLWHRIRLSRWFGYCNAMELFSQQSRTLRSIHEMCIFIQDYTNKNAHYYYV
jgi:hypothetical protein